MTPIEIIWIWVCCSFGPLCRCYCRLLRFHLWQLSIMYQATLVSHLLLVGIFFLFFILNYKVFFLLLILGMLSDFTQSFNSYRIFLLHLDISCLSFLIYSLYTYRSWRQGIWKSREQTRTMRRNRRFKLKSKAGWRMSETPRIRGLLLSGKLVHPSKYSTWRCSWLL